MANRKPTPKSQREISISQQEPYQQGGPGFQPTENPNREEGINRGEQLSFRNDTTKPIVLGIQDIDETIYYYFTEVIKPFVIQNGQRIAVPVVYGNPEKWKMVQKDGYYRDKNGKIMSPLLVFKRDDLTKVRNIGNKLDSNHPNLYSSFIKKYSPKNSYDNFSVLNNRIPQQLQYAIVIPDYVTIKYSCIIYTYYVEQMNKIVEAINYASDSYWGDPARFKFRAMIDSFTTSIEIEDGKDRAIKSNFEIKLNGYIIPDIIQKDLNAVKKLSNTTSISIFTEGTTSLDQ